MHIFVPDLYEDRTAFREQIPGYGEAVPQVRQVGVDSVAPGVAEGLDMYRFTGDVGGIAVFDVPTGGGPLEVGVELDAVGRIEVDALAPFHAVLLSLCERGHYLTSCHRGSCDWPKWRRAW